MLECGQITFIERRVLFDLISWGDLRFKYGLSFSKNFIVDTLVHKVVKVFGNFYHDTVGEKFIIEDGVYITEEREGLGC